MLVNSINKKIFKKTHLVPKRQYKPLFGPLFCVPERHYHLLQWNNKYSIKKERKKEKKYLQARARDFVGM